MNFKKIEAVEIEISLIGEGGQYLEVHFPEKHKIGDIVKTRYGDRKVIERRVSFLNMFPLPTEPFYA